MKIRFHTLGCKLNFAESSAIGKQLLADGHRRTNAGEEADVVILNTCSVTDAADHKARQAIHRLRRENPNATLIVTGCYAQLQPNEIIDIEGVDYVIGQQDKFAIASLVSRLSEQAADSEPSSHILWTEMPTMTEFFPSFSQDDRTRCFLKIQDGCDYFCSYCTIPYARGRSRNANIESTLSQVRTAINAGNKEIVLTGVNIGDFGKSTDETFLQLLEQIDLIDSDFRVRISSCEPNLLTDDIIRFVASSRHFAPHFHIPLQSGSNEVLKIMRRRYTRELFEERIHTIKSLMPDAFIGVDCMVGVRGETEEYFDDYYQFVESLPVSQLHVFTYSERAGTRMLELPLMVVPQKERKRRSELMHALSADKTRTFYAGQIGKEHTVLWESKREGTEMTGFTENYVRVHTQYERSKVNTFERLIISNDNIDTYLKA